MALAENIFAALTSAASKTLAIVGQSSDVFPAVSVVTRTAPYVAWQIIATEPQASHDDPDGLELAHVQFTCVGASYMAARDLRAAVRYDLKTAGLSVECSERDGFSEVNELFPLLLDASIWTAPAVPA
jgi:hypothetical protein